MTSPYTLLCLVSEQRMQNVIPLFHSSFRFDQLILVASGDPNRINPRFARIAEDLENALHDRVRCVMWTIPVDPMVPEETEAACRQILAESGGPEHVVVNFTGGTKPMSIGAYLAGLSAGCEMIYVDTQKEQIFRYQQGSLYAEPFQLSIITVGQVLALHGKPINAYWTQTKQPTEAERAFTRAIFAARQRALPHVLHLQNVLRLSPRNAAQERVVEVDLLEGSGELIALLEQSEDVRREGEKLIIGHRTSQYLDGGWLEQYVAYALREDGRFADVAGNLQLAGVDNELDVACTLNGKLAIVECKSGKMKGGEATEMVNRLRALKDSIAGTFGKTFLVTCHDTSRLSGQFLTRASEYVSKVIGFEHLANVEQVIYEEVALKQR